MNLDQRSTSEYAELSEIEIAILQQDIELPKLPREPLTLETLKKFERLGKEYKLMEREYENALGNFYVPILFPLVEDGESTDLEFDAPPTNNILNGSLKSSPYIEKNYIQLVIPKYIVCNFKRKIPKGTKFIIGFIGGNRSIENITILGLYGHSLLTAAMDVSED